MRRSVCAWCVCFILTRSIVIAENCPKYSVRDREIVRQQFTTIGSGSGFYVSAESGVMEILSRMGNIAYEASGASGILSASVNQTGQRAALNAEYQALIGVLNRFAVTTSVSMSPRTRLFIRNVVNSDYLGLSGTTVDGVDDRAAARRSDEAVIRIGMAMQRLWRCF